MTSELLPIGDCVQVTNGFAFKSTQFSNTPAGLPLARIRDVLRGYSETYYTGDYPDNALIHNGDLLIGMDGEFNLAYWKGGKALLNQRVCKVEAIPGKADIRYIRYALSIVLKRIEDRTPFATVKHLSSDDLKDELVRLPNLQDQARLAIILQRADQLLSTHRYALELCDEFLPSSFLEMFGDPATNPRGYPLMSGGELFDSVRGVKCGPFGSALKKHEYVSDGVPVWTMENVQENLFVEHGCAFITAKKFEELTAYDAQSGDILISRAGTVGRMAVVRTKAPRSVIHSNLIRLTLNRGRMLPEYFVVLMTYFGSRVAKLKTGQQDAYTFMNTGTLEELPIPVPPMPEQRKFLETLTGRMALRATHAEALRQSDHLFQTLLHDAFAQ